MSLDFTGYNYMLIGIIMTTSIVFSQVTNKSLMDWEVIAELPDEMGQPNKGLAGCFAGISNDVMLIGGGANFQNEMPWEGGKKYWSDKIYVLKRKGNKYDWHPKTFNLPHPIAYGYSITTPKGVLCIGGRDNVKTYSEVFYMKWEAVSESVIIEKLPELPIPLANLSASIISEKIYVAGGEYMGETTNHFFSLDISSNNSSDYKWTKLPSVPGLSRAYSVLQSQSNGKEHGLYLFSGRSYNKNSFIEILSDSYFFSPINNNWEPLDKEINFPVMAGNSFKSGLEFIFLPSGADGKEFLKIKSLEDSINRLDIIREKSKADSLKLHLRDRLINHKGFSKDVLVYNTITKTKLKISELPYGVVTAPIVNWNGNFFIISGETSPGVRTPSILKGHIKNSQGPFGYLNTLVLVIYFILLLCIGYFFSKRQKSTNDYFKGGGRLPWWAAGLSIFGTALSAITFMAIPAKAYSANWAYIWLNAGIILVAPLIIYFLIPIYRKSNITSAYHYLELRFNVMLRLIGSISFILFQIGRMAVILFLPALAINVVTGINIYTCVLSMGLLSLLYTLMGGIEAVIWTDALQVIVLIGGALLSLFFIITNVDGGFFEILNLGLKFDKINVFNMALDLNKPTFWVVIFGGYFSSLATYACDQTMVQRYLTTADKNGAVKSLLTNMWLSIPATLLFFFVGTSLFVFFRQHPETMNFSLTNGDAIFPWYIVKELPNGVVGLLISGILAAAMSSVSSSINSAATSYCEDIHFRFWNPTKKLKLARISTLFIGILGTSAALFMAEFEIKSLWDVFQKVLGLIIGSMSGLFILGVFFKRANSKGALIGFTGSLIIQILISNYTSIHLLLYTATGMIMCILIGILSSLIFTTKLKYV
jgi:SSS family solute:Na+ symporter